MPEPGKPAPRQAPPLAASKPAKRPWRKPVLFVLLLAMLGVAGWYAYSRRDEAADGWVTTAATRGDIEDSITATGTLQPKDYVDVGTQVSGQLRNLKVVLGASVKRGDLLAEIDPTVYQTKVDADRAQLRNQGAQLADRRSQLALARLQMARQRALARDEATTTDAVQSAEAALRSAAAQVESLKAQIEQTESTLRGDQASLGYTKIHAPMSGTVVSISAKQGQTLNANQQAPIVLRIADLASMTVQSQVSEADVGHLRLGMPVYFTTLAGDKRRFYGTLRQVSPTPTVLNNVVLYDALFDVPNPDQVLMTQMTAQVFFLAASARNAVQVPVSALRPLPRNASAGEAGETREPRESRAASASASAPTTGTAPAPGAGDAASAKRSASPVVAASAPTGRRIARAGVDARGQFSGRRALLSVIGADGNPVEREVQVGVVNRVSAQILSGVEPGEQVVIGRKTANGAAPARSGGATGLTPAATGGFGGGPR